MNNASLCDIIDFGKNSSIRNNLTISLEDYHKLTREYIIKYLNKEILRKHNIKQTFIYFALKNEDIFNHLLTTIMMADWTHDRTKSSQKYWRLKCILYTISKIGLKNKYRPQQIINHIPYTKTPEEENIEYEKHKTIEQAISGLNKRQRQITRYYFYKNLSQQEIGKKFNISQVRVNQILDNVKYNLAPYLESII